VCGGVPLSRWVSKLIRKRHDSSVTGVAWHPNNVRNFSVYDIFLCIYFYTLKVVACLFLISKDSQHVVKPCKLECLNVF
jgi:hypothetical protein